MQLKRLTEGGLGAKPPATGRIFVIFLKNKSYFVIIGSHFARTCLQPFVATRFLTFESQLKKLNCSVLILLAIEVQITFKILHFGVEF